MKVKALLLAAALCAAALGALASSPASPIRHVVLIGIDGLGAQYVPWSDMPTLSRLRDEGLYTVGRCSFPTSSGINWPSIFTGTIAELHGFRDNSGKPEVEPWRADAAGDGGSTRPGIPCVFSEVRRQRPNAWTASIYDWLPISHLHNTNAIDRVVVYRQKNWYDHTEHLALDVSMVDDFIAALDNDPTLVFFYQHSVDHAGHTYGWGSPEQTNACRHVDAQLARAMAALEEHGMAADTAVIVVSDHGGSGTKHGMAQLDCFEIPFIVWASALRRDEWRLREPVINADTAPTALALLGLEVPEAMRGRNALATAK